MPICTALSYICLVNQLLFLTCFSMYNEFYYVYFYGDCLQCWCFVKRYTFLLDGFGLCLFYLCTMQWVAHVFQLSQLLYILLFTLNDSNSVNLQRMVQLVKWPSFIYMYMVKQYTYMTKIKTYSYLQNIQYMLHVPFR